MTKAAKNWLLHLLAGVLLCACWPGPLYAGAQPQLGGCQMFPANNIWNTPVDKLPLDPHSATWVQNVGATVPLHPDWGQTPSDPTEPLYGIPYVIVRGTQPKVGVSFLYVDESDPGPYPIPPNAPIEGGPNASPYADRHVLVVDSDNCVLYEMYASFLQSDGTWKADSGAIFDLKTNALRPDGWTSADAAGLPILPGLVRYDEVAAGEIRHAIRLTVPGTGPRHIWPARHDAPTGGNPPLGARFRLRANFDISRFSPAGQVILRALKKYGMILADNGTAWFISGAPDPRWDMDTLVPEMRGVHGSDFEAVDSSSLMVNSDSGATKSAADNLVNAASFLPGPLSPGEIASIFGTGLGPVTAATATPDSAGVMPSLLGETRILFDGVAAPLLYTQDLQVNFIVPYAIAGKEATVMQTEYRGVKSAPLTLAVADAIPGIFMTGTGASARPAVFHADWSLNSPSNPVAKGQAVIFYLTGEGQTQPAGADGKLALAAYPQPLLPVTVAIGGLSARVDYAGAAPSYVAGLMQVNAFVPDAAPSGAAVPVVIKVGVITVQQPIAISIK